MNYAVHLFFCWAFLFVLGVGLPCILHIRIAFGVVKGASCMDGRLDLGIRLYICIYQSRLDVIFLTYCIYHNHKISKDLQCANSHVL